MIGVVGNNELETLRLKTLLASTGHSFCVYMQFGGQGDACQTLRLSIYHVVVLFFMLLKFSTFVDTQTLTDTDQDSSHSSFYI